MVREADGLMDVNAHNIIHQPFHLPYTVVQAQPVHHNGVAGVIPDADRCAL
ncbi:hypothetical protein D3C71_1975110 [compost metagenome]